MATGQTNPVNAVCLRCRGNRISSRWLLQARGKIYRGADIIRLGLKRWCGGGAGNFQQSDASANLNSGCCVMTLNNVKANHTRTHTKARIIRLPRVTVLPLPHLQTSEGKLINELLVGGVEFQRKLRRQLEMGVGGGRQICTRISFPVAWNALIWGALSNMHFEHN